MNNVKIWGEIDHTHSVIMARSFLGLGQLVVLLVLLSVAVRYSDSKSCVTVRAPSVALSG